MQPNFIEFLEEPCLFCCFQHGAYIIHEMDRLCCCITCLDLFIQVVLLSTKFPAGYRTLRQDVEEGICQVVAHMWLENELRSGSGLANEASSSSSSFRTSKVGARSPFEKKLGEFFKHQIEADISPVYGDGFRAAHQAVKKYGLSSTLSHIWMTSTFPC